MIVRVFFTQDNLTISILNGNDAPNANGLFHCGDTFVSDE